MSNKILMMENRQLIPRWHTSRKAHRFNYPSTENPRNSSSLKEDYWFKKSVDEWKANPSVDNAIDVFVRFVQADERSHPLYIVLQRQLLEQHASLKNAVKQMVCPELKLFDPLDVYATDNGPVRGIIRKLKNVVKYNPRDSLSWMDLGFYYSVIGELTKAHYCVDVARNLDPNNAFIARSYSRFLVHIGDPERAVWYLSNRPNLNSNPLILSASTAISSAFDIKTPNIKKAVSLLKNWSGDPTKVSELAACVGTIELKNGAIKQAKKHIQVALKGPSENVIAHIQWIHSKHNFYFENMPDIAGSIEGCANALYKSKKFQDCRDKLVEMHNFQPYSIGPIVDAGYLSVAALDDPEFVIRLSDERIPHSHMQFGELNNLIVAKLLLNKTNDIDVDLDLLARRVSKENPHAIATFKATAGMALLVSGMIEEGIRLYDDSIELLSSTNQNRSVCIAKHFYAKQIEKYYPEKANQLRADARKLANKYGVLEIGP